MELVAAKTILQRNKSLGWFGCEYNMNIYRGCCHGCLYCDSRSDCYHLEDFDRVRAKKDALRILRDDLARKAVKGVVATGAMSDPYNPFEAQHLLTRNALSLLDAYGFGVAIATKSALVCRDADILRDIAVHSPVLCKITLTTVDDALAAKVEPGAPSPTRRLAACEELANQGVFCGFLLMPVLPFIEDDEAAVLALVRRAAAAGARFIYPSFGVTMRAGQREYFLQGLDAAFPGEGYGQRYRSHFGNRYFCASPNARQLWQAFSQACAETGLLHEMLDIVRAYRQGRQTGQLSFL
ncbi:radical SAM protein [Ruminococcaceae bacterium OttesenSCG-928-O06]|nr:radical SAM protein [Ruminococcaceae bacterium OttesenSCG-928-O06]